MLKLFQFKIVVVILSIIIPWTTSNSFEKILERNGIKYLSNTLIVKLKNTPNLQADKIVSLENHLTEVLSTFNLKKAISLFPNKVFESDNSLGRIIEIKYDSKADPLFVASKISNLDLVEWAEPRYVYELSFIPNDPFFNQQYALTRINAMQAWDITQGDTSISIGIVDTGVDWDHPDLAANIWINRNEIPNNGIDDDGNGFIDDIRGWDFGGLNGTPDNNPMEDQPDHGTHVAGIASAVTNNAIGVASIGFKSKIMAIKTSRNDYRGPYGPYIVYGYEGIVYAADNRAAVINCSWGSTAFSIFGQEIINYAITKNSLVIGAAGNLGSTDLIYPAMYNGAISVASTNSNDTRSSFSNYGRSIDLCAPGSNIYNTWQNDTYATLSGTSMSAPLVAGLAALVKARFPNYNAIQLGEQIRVNCDNINSVNPSLQFLLGSGRINAYNSLNNTSARSVRAVNLIFSDEQPGGNGDGIFQSGEIISLRVVFINYLYPTTNLSVQLESRTSFSTVQNGTVNFGSVNTLQQFNNFNNKFTFQIANSTPQNATITFLLRYSDGSYSDFQWIEIIANPTFATQSGNNVKLTITSKGTLAFNDYPNNLQGQGFRFQDSNNQLFEGALIIGNSPTRISDAARGLNQAIQNSDFAVVQPFTLRIPGNIADVEGFNIFNDNNAGSNRLGITAKLRSFSFAQNSFNNFIILMYTFINNSSNQINNLYTALFLDWDLVDGYGDITNWDNNIKYGVTRNQNNPNLNWVGVGLISATNYGFYAIKNDSGDGGFGIYDGFADHEKWLAISSGINKVTAGPGDVSQVVSSGPYSININDSVTVAFVIAGGTNKQNLDLAIQNARIKYQQIVTNIDEDFSEKPLDFKLNQNYPNPFNPITKITWQTPIASQITIKLFNSLGELVDTIIDGYFEEGTHSINYRINPELPSGVYYYQLKAEYFLQTKKMILLK